MADIPASPMVFSIHPDYTKCGTRYECNPDDPFSWPDTDFIKRCIEEYAKASPEDVAKAGPDSILGMCDTFARRVKTVEAETQAREAAVEALAKKDGTQYMTTEEQRLTMLERRKYMGNMA